MESDRDTGPLLEFLERVPAIQTPIGSGWSVEQEEVEATKSAGRYVVGIELFSPFLFMSMVPAGPRDGGLPARNMKFESRRLDAYASLSEAAT